MDLMFLIERVHHDSHALDSMSRVQAEDREVANVGPDSDKGHAVDKSPVNDRG